MEISGSNQFHGHEAAESLPDTAQDLRCSEDLTVKIEKLKGEIKNSSGIQKLFNKLGISPKAFELRKLQGELQNHKSPKSKLAQFLVGLKDRVTVILKKKDCPAKVDALREKNLRIARMPDSEKPEAKVTFDESQLAGKGVDVHGGRVWLTKKTTTSTGETKAAPSTWFRKDKGIFEIVAAPLYSLLVPGSPEGRLVKVKGEVRDYHDYASKQIEGARSPTKADLKSGKMKGLANCAVAAAIFGCIDIRPGNALLNKHNRMVMLDYEFHDPKRENIQNLLENPLGRAEGYFDSMDGPGYDDVKEHESSPKFKEEMNRAFIHFLAFPTDMLLGVVDKRLQAASIDWKATDETTRLAGAIGMLKEELLGGSPEAAGWREGIGKMLEGDLDALARGIVNDMADSRILRELNYDMLVGQIKNNLKSLREVFH